MGNHQQTSVYPLGYLHSPYVVGFPGCFSWSVIYRYPPSITRREKINAQVTSFLTFYVVYSYLLLPINSADQDIHISVPYSTYQVPLIK